MKLNIAYPSLGLQKLVDIDDEKKLLPFFEKRIGAEVPGDSIGEEFKGYVFRITGGNDKQGFPMMQGILVNHRVRLLFKAGMKCYRPRRTGEKKRKSVRGAIVGPDISVLSLVVVKKGSNDIPGLTDSERPRRLGPKRASKIRRLFNLTPEQDVCKFVVRRQIEGKKNTKAPKIQRLITKTRLQRKRRVASLKKKQVIASRAAVQEFKEQMHQHKMAKKAHKHAHAPVVKAPAPAVKAAPAKTKAAAAPVVAKKDAKKPSKK